MSSSPAIEPSSPSTTPSSPALRAECAQFQTSTPNYSSLGRKQHHPPLNVVLPATAPATPPIYGEPTLTPPPRSPGAPVVTPASGDSRAHPPDGTSSDKSSETAVGGVSRTTSTALSRKESYKAQRQHYRREKKRVASALLHSIEDPSVVVLADWLKVRGSLKSWTKLWCVLKPGLLLLYKSPKAKSSHWVGTVLLTSCQVIERPSKKDGFCFKLYHPLEQSIWAPRGPHNETIGAVVQPLPTAHLIFRAPSQAAGHCWLDGLELALKCSNAMLRCSRARPEQTVAAEEPSSQTNLSHEELEKHFNEHVLKSGYNTPLMSIPNSRQSPVEPKRRKSKTIAAKWASFIGSIESVSKCDESSGSQTPDEKKDARLLDIIRRKETDRWSPFASKSLASSPRMDLVRKSALKCFDKKALKGKISPTITDENLFKMMSFPKRRSSTPSTLFLTQNKMLRESGVKSDTENDEVFAKSWKKKRCKDEVLCATPENIIITKTAPSMERFREYSSTSSNGSVDC
ncbi:hypothetical protein O3G_MSEX014083, partial [Manduca sexta]